MIDIDNFRTPAPVCPHCAHEMTSDEMVEHASGCLFDVAHSETTVQIDCSQCGARYWCQGSWTPVFTTSAKEDDL